MTEAFRRGANGIGRYIAVTEVGPYTGLLYVLQPPGPHGEGENVGVPLNPCEANPAAPPLQEVQPLLQEPHEPHAGAA